MRTLIGIGILAGLSLGLGGWLSLKATRNKPGLQPRWPNLILAVVAMGATLAVWWGFHAYGIDIFRPRTRANDVFFIVMGSGIWMGLGIQVWQRRRAGELLLDLAPAAARNLWRCVAVLCIVGAIPLLTDRTPSVLWQAVFRIGLGCNLIFWASGRLQVRERGILTPMGLLRWEKIRSHVWKNSCTMRLAIRSYVPWVREVDLQVPVEHVPEMDRFFASHLAASSCSVPQIGGQISGHEA